MQSAAKRIEHYRNRMLSSEVDPVLAAVVEAQKVNFAAYASEYYNKQLLVHQYLDGEGVEGPEYFNYNAWAGEIYHVSKHQSGAGAVATATSLRIKYLGMGCTAPRLTAIAALFGIVIP